MLFSFIIVSLLFPFHTVLGAAIDAVLGSLGPLLSKNASIVHSTSEAPRWSDFDAPTPGTVVNVATERDVLITVQYCIAKNIPFLAQNGAHGWSTTFDLKQNGLLINLRGIQSVTFNAQRTKVTVQGGALVSDVIAAAYANNAQVTTGNCNCVGTLGAILGGGYGNLMGLYGFGVDNLLSLRLVTPAGSFITVTPDDTDLWWALRGTGPNFGIVTSAVMKSYPIPANQSTAWLGGLTFTEDKLESLVQAINDLILQPKMNIFMYYLTSGAPNYTPTIVATVFYYGTEAEGKAAFASIYAIGPSTDGTGIVDYPHWNDGAAGFCIKGDRKPSYGAGFTKMVPATWRAVWNEFVAFTQNPGTGNSVVLMEAYSLFKARSVPDSSSSFPFRSAVNFNAVAIAWYADASLDQEAEAFGSAARDLWRSTDGLDSNSRQVLHFFITTKP
ncbi:MAG: hypothetical protein Q9187_002353 [Circinaria calcarea]